MFYQRSYIKKLFRNYSVGTATADELIELKAGFKVFTEDEMLGLIGETMGDEEIIISGKEIRSAMSEAISIVERAANTSPLVS